MDTASTPYKVHPCSKCPGYKEYYCVSCPCDLCPQCKESHVKDLKTINHDVVSHRDNINYIPKQEICVRHPSKTYVKYCKPCELPICNYCRDHISHEKNDVRTTFKIKQQQHKRTIHTIRSEALFYRPILLSLIKADFKTCHTKLSLCQSDMLTKARRQEDCINYLLYNLLNNVFCDFDFQHRCLKQQIEMSRHIVTQQRYEHSYEQSGFTFSALKFLSSIKTALHQIHVTLHTSQLSMTESLNKEDVKESLTAIQITKRRIRRVGNEYLLKLTSGAEFHQSLTVTGIHACDHISGVTSDWVWVSDWTRSILTDTSGVALRRNDDLCTDSNGDGGLHTVSGKNVLIYIDRKYNINKLSKDINTATTIIERPDTTWEPRCVYWSPSTGDLLVGMYNYRSFKVTRYNQSGRLTQTIQHDNTGPGLYNEANYITENNNGDVVVSDSCAVVVTEHGGRHRFSYTGHPTGSGLQPQGICTDALSHILVCDERTSTVQMLDKDGQFLSHLLIRPPGIFLPHSLSYDANTHRLWVGSRFNNTIVIYRYITRQDALTGLNPATADLMEKLNEIPKTETEKPQQDNECLLKLMSPPESLHSFTLTGVDSCYHISCVTSDRVWVSDNRNSLILTNTIGVPLHRVEDSCRYDIFRNAGLHTVNSESELIYVNRNYNINKLSNDLKTTSTFIETTDSTWRPQCVYWSPTTGDLLVGMYNYNTGTGKVTRYNQSGQLTQTIQHDKTVLKLYIVPHYITENNNGDVVVSDFYRAVVVTERGGRHRFSYTGHASGSELLPRGICTDALSHILVCDGATKTIHMINKDGQFLSHLLTNSQEMCDPCGVCYDVNTHRLWVGSEDKNTVVIYKYISRQDAHRDEHAPRPDMDAMSCSTPAVEWSQIRY